MGECAGRGNPHGIAGAREGEGGEGEETGKARAGREGKGEGRAREEVRSDGAGEVREEVWGRGSRGFKEARPCREREKVGGEYGGKGDVAQGGGLGYRGGCGVRGVVAGQSTMRADLAKGSVCACEKTGGDGRADGKEEGQVGTFGERGGEVEDPVDEVQAGE